MKHLIIGSGAMMLYLFLGAIHCLSDKGLLSDVQEISCASCGSLIGLFFVFFFGNMEKIIESAIKQSLEDFAKGDIKNLIKKFGFLDANKMEKLIVDALGYDVTFKELYDLNPIKLHISTYEVTTGRTIYMSVDTTPDMKVSHAIRMSVSVPFIITPCIENGQVFVDGSTFEVSPYVPFIGKNDVFEIRWRRNPIVNSVPKNLLTFIKLFIFSLSETSRISSQYTEFDRIDLISPDDSLAYNWTMNDETKFMLIREGYSQASFIEKRNFFI
jgi:predicted acylesterase/phospholipase RssA